MKDKFRQIKKSCALLLSFFMLFTAVPQVAFAAVSNQAVQQNSAEQVAANVANQVLRGGKSADDKISIDKLPEYSDDDSVDIIVVVDNSTAAPESVSQIKTLKDSQDKVAKKISNDVLDGNELEINHRYTTLVNGFSTTVTYGEYKNIKNMDCFDSVFISPKFKLIPTTANSNKMIGGGLYNETGFNGEGMTIAILDTGVDMNHEIFRDSPKNPSLTQEKLQGLLDQYDFQAESIVKGVGASTLYHSEKIPFQFDYGDKDTDGSPTDSDHGTHVASTAAGNTGVNAAAFGVAPQAQILDMKVFQKAGGADYSDILCALEDCVLLDVDVVNMSLGSDCGYIDYDTEDAWTKNLLAVFNKVGEHGISMAVAAGNAYSATYGNAFKGKALASNPDYGIVSEPSTYNESLSVAAVNNGTVLSPYITVNDRKIAYNDAALVSDDENSIAMRTLSSKGEIAYEVVPDYGTADDFSKVDVKDKIALVSRGGGMFYEEKLRNAAAAGAIGMIVYNNTDGMLYMSIEDWKMPAVFISQKDGEYMKSQDKKVLSIASADAMVDSPVYGMCDFSSWGCTGELTLKPEVTAPGGGIYAAVPGNAYESMDGTSMASPHVAGAMAIVQQALESRYSDKTHEEIKNLTDTLLMNTAHIVKDNDGVAVSPRKQGAGLINIGDAVNSKGYVTVAGMDRPKIELKDDPERKGVYSLDFTVHNTSNETLYYDVKPIVLTDGTETYADGEGKENTLTSQTSVELPHTFTTNLENNRVAVEAGKTADVKVTVTLTDAAKNLAAFENGAYVEGWAVLNQVAADGSELDGAVNLGVPFLAFYGDWTQAPTVDSGFYWDELDGSTSNSQAYTNTAFLSSNEKTVDTYLGDNNYFSEPYLADRNAISPNSDDFMDSLTGIYTGLLRNTKNLKYTITGEDGTVYYSKDCEYVPKSIYSYDYYRIVPAGVSESDGIEPWYGTDINGSKLPNNTKATVKIETTLPFADHDSSNKRSSWEFPITVDTEEPEATEIKTKEEEGRYYLNVSVKDNQYVAAVIFYNLKNTSLLYGGQGFAENEPGMTSTIENYDVTGMGERFGMVVHDYAGNSRTYTVTVPGNTDDYAEVNPTNVLWQEDFNNDWLPADWSKESKGNSVNTWHRDEDYMATVDYDDNNEQNEWLYTRGTDISGVKTEAHMVFDFSTAYWFTTQYKHCNLLVMASDDGENWDEIWNLWNNAGLFTDWTKTQAKVKIPEKFQDSTNLRFAFVYQGKGGCNLSIDDVILYADELSDYATVTASQGENGVITPSGETLVKLGTSKTFTVTPDEGYEIENVKVDDKDVGPISHYTFERVGTNHTISATFKKAEAGGGEVALFNNDFNVADKSAFPGQGWSVKTKDTGASYYTWYSGRNTIMADAADKNDKQALIDWDEYDDGGWSVTEPQSLGTYGTGAVQDEYLVSPAADLTGKAAKLNFKYMFGRTALFNGDMKLTVEATTDGGNTWTTVWDASKDLTKAESGSYQIGEASLDVPDSFKTANVQFAFHYYKALGKSADKAGIDNVSLTVPGEASAAEYTLTTASNEGGIVTPEGATKVEAGKSVSVSYTPNEGYTVASVKVNGRTVDAEGSYTIESMDQSYYVEVEFEKIPETPSVLFENDFEDSDFPGHGWTVKATDTTPSYGTWKQYKYTTFNATQCAYVADDWKNSLDQDEYLVSPAVDLTGSDMRTLTFDYAYGYYGVKDGTFKGTLEASTDGGATWKELWNVKDTLPSSATAYVIKDTVDLQIPEEYAVSGVQFAFHYVHKGGAETGIFAVDNVSMKATGLSQAETHTITAGVNGQGGTISPSGTVTVKDGEDQKFAFTSDTGYEVADVVVDGTSVGKVSEYTFTNVKEDHTITVSFKSTASSVQFDNDFEGTEFPGNGWTVKSYGSKTWASGMMSQMNSTKVARVDADNYDEYSYTGGGKQDEYLVSPDVDLTGSKTTLSFDYGFGRYALFNKAMTLTAEISVDDGATWNVIWDAAALENGSGYMQTGSAEVDIPSEYRKADAKIAFHYTKPVYSWGSSEADPVAVDNVKLEEKTTSAYQAVIDMIDALPDADKVTLDDEEAVKAARAAYDALTDEEKAKVTNYDKLVELEQKLEELKKQEEDKAAAQKVIDLIDKISDPVTLDSEADIKAAREAYDALTDEQKALVTNYEKLVEAEKALEELKAPKVEINKLIGNDRYETAVKVSQAGWQSSEYAVIAGGEAYVDALVASPLASIYNAPVLLTEQDNLTDVTLAELERLKVKTVFIIGGAGVVSDDVQTALQDMGIGVMRFGGSDRYDTSLKVAKYIDRVTGTVTKAYVVGGEAEADAVSIASKAAAEKQPILLVEKDAVPYETLSWLADKKLETAYVIGGLGVVSDEVIDALNKVTSADISGNRVWGADRYDTNAAVVKTFYAAEVDSVIVTRGLPIIDALVAAPYAAKADAPIVIVGDELTDMQKEVLDAVTSPLLVQVGGQVSEDVVNELAQLLSK